MIDKGQEVALSARGPTPLFYFSGSLWIHSVIVCSVAAAIVFTARIIGLAHDGEARLTVFIHSIIIVVIGYGFNTLFASTAMYALRHRLPLVVCAILGCVVGALPSAFVTPTISWALDVMPAQLSVGGTREAFIEDLSTRWVNVFSIYVVLGTTVWMVFNFVWWRDRFDAEDRDGERGAVHMADSKEAPVLGERGLLSKMPVQKRGTVLALSAEQHYVRVHTVRGNDLILIRLTEAIEQFDPEDGMRIHRSHWIKRSAVEELINAEGRLALRLSNGLELPVSRSFSGAVKEEFG